MPIQQQQQQTRPMMGPPPKGMGQGPRSMKAAGPGADGGSNAKECADAANILNMLVKTYRDNETNGDVKNDVLSRVKLLQDRLDQA